MTQAKGALGRGLSTLLGDAHSDYQSLNKSSSFQVEPIENIHPCSSQPRRFFSEQHLEELKQSIAEKGVLQPLIVRNSPEQEGKYEIIAGERRWRASKLANLSQVPIIIKELSDQEVLQIALIENIQRENLTPLEEAKGYVDLCENYGYTQKSLAQMLGKSRSHIANMMRLVALPADVQEMINDGLLTMGHAKVLVNLENASKLAQKIISKKMSVREAEKMVSKSRTPVVKENSLEEAADKVAVDMEFKEIEDILKTSMGMDISIQSKASGGGVVSFHYRTLGELDDLMQRLIAQDLDM